MIMIAPACSWAREAKAASISLSVAASDGELHALGAGHRLHLRDTPFAFELVGFHQQGDHPAWGASLGKQFERIAHGFAAEIAESREVAARPARLLTSPSSTGSPAPVKRSDRRGPRLAASAASEPAVATMTSTLRRPDRRPRRTTDRSALRPSVFDGDILPLDMAGFAQPLAEGS